MEDEAKSLNVTDFGSSFSLPMDMQFNQAKLLTVIIYSVLMLIGGVANINVFYMLLRLHLRGRGTKLNYLLLHLSIADLLVVFLLMPSEIIWSLTVRWKAGDFMCRVVAFLRIFGLYLSNFVLVVICINRYYAIMHPLKTKSMKSKVKFFAYGAWFMSAICSLPQLLVFSVQPHPNFIWYEQCVTFGALQEPTAGLAYISFGILFIYLLPLAVIIFTYVCICWKIYQKARTNRTTKRHPYLSRSTKVDSLNRAKIKTLKMTVVIVLVFIICWTPYHVMCLWYWLDMDSANQVDYRVSKILYMFACANSCMNPIVYRSHIKYTPKNAPFSLRDYFPLVSLRERLLNTPTDSRNSSIL